MRALIVNDHPAVRAVLERVLRDEPDLVPLVAGADGIANKGGSGDDLCQAIRAVALGHPAFPAVPPPAVSAIAAGLDASDVPILGMLVHGNLGAEIADALGITEPPLDARRWAILKRLTAPPGRPDPGQTSPADRSMARPALAHQSPEHGAMTVSQRMSH